MYNPEKKSAPIPSSEITDEAVFRQRRTLLKASMTGAMGGAAGALLGYSSGVLANAEENASDSGFRTSEELTSKKTVTSYNNFYELGTDKGDPARNADLLVTDPWSVEVDGECNKPGKLTLEDILKPHDIEERIYRLRCVEAWSMVVPWNGFSLGNLLKRFEPNGNAKYVSFETIVDDRLPGMRTRVLEWPYREGLRMDEAMHPLTMIATGVYGEDMPNQNGAPLRLVIPWKYGFKSIKSIVKISFTEKQPATSWNMSAPHEYGFYSNVNPDVSHPRWSQAKERRLAGDAKGVSALFAPKIETKFLNGYADQVASLYTDMDLKQNF